METLREAAKVFYNLTIADTTVIIRPNSAEKRDAIKALAEALMKSNDESAKADQSAYTTDAERIRQLSDEIEANEEENRAMQEEIDILYAKIDSER